MLEGDRHSKKWPTNGRIGYVTLAVGAPTALGSPKLHNGKHSHNWPTKGRMGYTIPDPPKGRGDIANLPTCGPLLTLSPAVKHWRAPKRQG